MAFDGTNFLLAWEYGATDPPNTQTTHVAAGRLEDHGYAIDVNITTVSNLAGTEEGVDVAFDGSNYVVAWFNHPPSNLGTVRVARFSTAGALLDPVGGQATTTSAVATDNPRIARLGSETFVVWEQNDTLGINPGYRIAGTRISSASMALDTTTFAAGLWVSVIPPASS